MFLRIKQFFLKYIWRYLKIPVSYVLIVMGHIFEFFICLPFLLIMYLDRFLKKKAQFEKR